MKKNLSQKIAYIYGMLFAKPYFQKINMLMFNMAIRGLGILNFYDDAVSGEKHFVNNVLPKYVSSKFPIIYDVGANIGTYSLMILKAFPDAQIFAFEPHPNSFSQLIKKQSFSPKIRCFNLALGSQFGNVTLYDRMDFDGSEHATLNEGVIEGLFSQKPVSHTVKLDTIDNVSKKNNIDFIDFLKIDTEGSEYKVLEGAKDLIARKGIGVIQFEFNEMNLYSRVFFHDFKMILPGYDLFRLLPYGLLELPEKALVTELFGYQNLVAIRSVK
jgi:FkbM family methyltransferase